MKKIKEKLMYGYLMISGGVTGIIILFIIIFLFSEGIGLFQSKNIENGYALYLNTENVIEELSPEEITNIFDGKITNWKEVRGQDLEIITYRFNDLLNSYSESDLDDNYEHIPLIIEEHISENKGIIAYLPTSFAPEESDFVRILSVGNIELKDFFIESKWMPTSEPVPLFGSLSLIIGTLLVGFLAIIIALPLGLGLAVYLSELANKKVKKVLKPVIELLAGIPSVVYGFFGLIVLAPIVQKVFKLPIGETALTGALVLAIMALPTIVSVAEDALNNTPRELKEASLALGANQWETIQKVVFPYAKSGILAAIVLGVGRAIGETMAVLMVTGNAAILPSSVFQSVRTIPATIAAELGEAPTGGVHYQALFLLGIVLFLFTLMTSVVGEVISKKKY